MPELQLVSAMLVILFLILYREHKKGQKQLSEALKTQVDRLKQAMEAIDSDLKSLTEKMASASETPQTVGSKTPSRSTPKFSV
jgi:predicted  nucleic acid-binding Zn-ribbon protein